MKVIMFLILFCSINYALVFNSLLIQMSQIKTAQNVSSEQYIVESLQLSEVLNPRTVVEHAEQINSSQLITSYYYNSTDSTTIGQAFNELAPDWQCNQIDVEISNLEENRSWLKDPGFEYIGNWTTGIKGKLSYFNDWDYEISDGEGTNSSKGANLRLDCSGDYSNFVEAWVEQNITINRTDLTWLGINFDYKAFLDSIWDPQEAATFQIAVQINQNFSDYVPEKTYTYWNYNESGIPDISLLNDYDIVIWSTGDSSSYYGINTLESEDRELLENYLDNEGKVFLTGDDIGYDAYYDATPWTDWLEDRFGASYQGDSSGAIAINGVANYAYNGLSEVNVTGYGFYDYFSGSPGTVAIEYDDVPAAQNDAAINQSSSDHNNRTMFFGFSFEDIVNEIDQINIMDRTLNYLNSTARSVLYIDDSHNIYSSEAFFDSLEGCDFESIWKTVYLVPFTDIEEENTWYNTGMIPISTEFIPRNSTHINLHIKIALKHSVSITLSPEPNPEIWIDNFNLYLQTPIAPSDINLTLNDISVFEEENGGGNYTQILSTPLTSNPVISNFTWDPNPLPDPQQDFYISFDCNSTMICSKTSQSTHYLDQTGVNLNVESGENATWNFYYWNSIPTGYENHYLNISKPLDWNMTFVSAPLTDSINEIEHCSYGGLGTSFILVPTQNITNFPTGYWTFNATSFNYHDDLMIQAWNGTNWNNQTEYFAGNECRVMLQVFNETGIPPPDLSTFSANVTITHPESNIWYYNETFYSGGDGIIYFPNLIINGTDTFGGIYEINAAWTNGEEICYKSTTFTIKHSAELILYKPDDAMTDAEASVTYGDLLLIKMRLNDTDKIELIKNSSLTLNWTDGSQIIKNFTDLNTGEYELILDTAELPEIKNYTLIINSTHQYYSNDTYSLKLVVLADTVLISPQFPRISEPWGDNITIDYFYNISPSGTGIGDATYVVEYPGPYTMVDLTNGHYQLEINTSTVSISEHLVNVSFQKPNLYPKNLTIKVNIHEKETKLIQDTITSVPHGDNVTISVKYSTLDNNPIAPDVIEESIISLNGSLIYNVTYNDYANQKYHIELNTSNLNKYDIINITAQKSKYYAQSLLTLIPYRDIFLEIVPLNDTFIEIPNNVTYTNFSIYLNDTEHNKPVNNANFTFLGFTEINATFISNGIYRISLNSCNVVEQPYNILITSIAENYLQDSLQIVLQVKNWSNFYEITTNDEIVQTITEGSSVSLNFNFYNEFYGVNESNPVYYSWVFGSGTLSNTGNGNYTIDISTSGKAPGTYQMVIFVNDSQGVLLASQTITIVIQQTAQPLPWWVQYGWIIGLLGGALAAAIAVIAGYFTRNKLKEKGWEKKVKHIYVLHNQTGAPLFDRHVGETKKLDPGLVTSALLGISSILHEIVQSKEKRSRIKTIDHMDQKILFSHGYHVTTAMMSSVDLPVIRKKLNDFTQSFERRFADGLKNYVGETAPFMGAKKLVNEVFPFTKVAESLEITAQWANDNIIEIYGTIGLDVLQTISLGLTEMEQIMAGTGMNKDKLEPLLRTLNDLNLVDSNNKITKKGKAAIKLYKDEKERYFNIKKIIEGDHY